MTADGDDQLDRLGETPERRARFLEMVPELVSDALGERDAVGIVLDDDGAAWLTRGGERVTTLDPSAMGSLARTDQDRAVRALVELVRRYERELGFREALVEGTHVRIDHKNANLRRTFRTVGTVRRLDPFRPGAGVRSGGWTVEIEVRPRFGKPTIQRIESETIVEVVRV